MGSVKGEWSHGHYAETAAQALAYLEDDPDWAVEATDAQGVPYVAGDTVVSVEDGASYRVKGSTEQGLVELYGVEEPQYPTCYDHDQKSGASPFL